MKPKGKITVMIQARSGSNRLPKKVLANIERKPLIFHVINRIKKVKKVEQIILITTKKKKDKILLNLAKKYDILGFAGNELDVLDRHYQCAKMYNADPIIRITGDCPLMDQNLIKKILDFYIDNKFDYVSNTIDPTYPDGLDIEVFSFRALEEASLKAKLKSEREHVTPFIKNDSNKFKIFNYKNNTDLSHHRWTVDEKNDLKFVRKIYKLLRPQILFSSKKILKIIAENPKIADINSGIMRNEGYLKSLQNE